MNDLYVDVASRGKGIGKALFTTAVDYTREHGYAKMEWMTEPDNHPARSFYDAMGGKHSDWIYYSIKS